MQFLILVQFIGLVIKKENLFQYMSFERLSKTEIVHGRIAMSGVLFVLILEIATKINFS